MDEMILGIEAEVSDGAFQPRARLMSQKASGPKADGDGKQTGKKLESADHLEAIIAAARRREHLMLRNAVCR
jgi:hypothetical protein